MPLVLLVWIYIPLHSDSASWFICFVWCKQLIGSDSPIQASFSVSLYQITKEIYDAKILQALVTACTIDILVNPLKATYHRSRISRSPTALPVAFLPPRSDPKTEGISSHAARPSVKESSTPSFPPERPLRLFANTVLSHTRPMIAPRSSNHLNERLNRISQSSERIVWYGRGNGAHSSSSGAPL